MLLYNAVLKPSTTIGTLSALGNDAAASGDVDAIVARNTFETNDFSSGFNGDIDFPMSGVKYITRGADTASFDGLVANNTFTLVGNANYEKGYSTDLIAAAAVRFIKSHADDESPFLCYVPFNAPHSPFQAKEEDLPLYADLAAAKGNWTGANTVNPQDGADGKLANRRILGAMVHALDQGIGSILDALDEAGIAENTFVIFSSDNGGVGGIGENTPLRGAKASAFEGGIRVAAAARWPGKIPAGGKIEIPMANIDVLPTVMRIAGVESSGGKRIDGVDILDVLTGEQQSLDRELFNYIGQIGLDSEQISYMTNEWKLLVIGRVVSDESADDSTRRIMLFHIREDMAEEHGVAGDNPEIVAKMYEKIKGFRALQPVDAILPYNEGRNSGFTAPKEWRIPVDYPE